MNHILDIIGLFTRKFSSKLIGTSSGICRDELVVLIDGYDDWSCVSLRGHLGKSGKALLEQAQSTGTLDFSRRTYGSNL